MKVRIARSAAELDRLGGLWDHLYQHDRSTLFQSFLWNRHAAAHFAAREAPYVVAVEGDSGAALIPAAIAGGLIVFLGECLFDYRDILLAGDPAAVRRGWEELAKLRLPLSITALHGGDRRDRLAALGPVPFCNAPGVRRADVTAEQFTADHNRLGRHRRRMERQGAHFRQYSGTAADALRWIYDRKAAQFEGSENNIFRDHTRVDFMVAIAAAEPAQCDIFTLETDTHIVAGLVTFRDGALRRFYTVYFDPAWAQYSPGTVLIFEVTRRSLADGLDCDYMTGEQPHKRRFATFQVPLFRVEATPEGIARAAADLVPAAA